MKKLDKFIASLTTVVANYLLQDGAFNEATKVRFLSESKTDGLGALKNKVTGHLQRTNPDREQQLLYLLDCAENFKNHLIACEFKALSAATDLFFTNLTKLVTANLDEIDVTLAGKPAKIKTLKTNQTALKLFTDLIGVTSQRLITLLQETILEKHDPSDIKELIELQEKLTLQTNTEALITAQENAIQELEAKTRQHLQAQLELSQQLSKERFRAETFKKAAERAINPEVNETQAQPALQAQQAQQHIAELTHQLTNANDTLLLFSTYFSISERIQSWVQLPKQTELERIQADTVQIINTIEALLKRDKTTASLARAENEAFVDKVTKTIEFLFKYYNQQKYTKEHLRTLYGVPSNIAPRLYNTENHHPITLLDYITKLVAHDCDNKYPDWLLKNLHRRLSQYATTDNPDSDQNRQLSLFFQVKTMMRSNGQGHAVSNGVTSAADPIPVATTASPT